MSINTFTTSENTEQRRDGHAMKLSRKGQPLLRLVFVLLAILCPALVSAQDGQLHSDSYWVRMYNLSSGGYQQVESDQFRGCNSTGDMNKHSISSPSFEILTGPCARLHWLLADGIGGQPADPTSTVLGRPTPNPVSEAAFLPYSIKEGEVASLRIYDVAGRLVRTLEESVIGPEIRAAKWNLRNDSGRKVGTGIYFARLKTGETEITRRVVVLGP